MREKKVVIQSKLNPEWSATAYPPQRYCADGYFFHLTNNPNNAFASMDVPENVVNELRPQLNKICKYK